MSAANGEAVVPIPVVRRIDVAGTVEVEVVGAAAVRVWGRRPVVAVVAGVGEQVAVLIDDAAPWMILMSGVCSTDQGNNSKFSLAVTK